MSNDSTIYLNWKLLPGPESRRLHTEDVHQESALEQGYRPVYDVLLLNILHVLFLSLSAKVEKDLSNGQAVFTEVIRIEYAYTNWNDGVYLAHSSKQFQYQQMALCLDAVTPHSASVHLDTDKVPCASCKHVNDCLHLE